MLPLQVNALDSVGQTSLHHVAQQGNMQACRILLQYGIDRSIVSLQGCTAAQMAPSSLQKMLRDVDSPSGGTDVDIQLLEAAKAGDLEVVKVT